MLYFLAEWMQASGGPSIFTYITSRALFGFITALAISLLIGRPLIRQLFLHGYRDYPRDYGSMSVGDKKGTPTMGGIIILISSLLCILLWCDLSNPRVWIVVSAILLFACLGYFDDKAKKDNKSADGGASRIFKMIPQIAYGIALGVMALHPSFGLFPDGIGDAFYLPFLKDPILHLRIGGNLPLLVAGIPLLIWGIVWSGGITNAVNYTDGLDGMLSVPALFSFLVLGVFSYVMGNQVLSGYLFYPFIDGTGELAVVCSIYMGCCLGFLWFNTFPAEVFMGDLGSLMLGGVMMTISFLLRQEMVFVLVGGIFVFEFLTSVVQDYYFIRMKGQRFFRQAPFHRSLNKSHGIAEPKVVVRYWIVAAMLAALALISLKLR
jgi:phospho-N-acetylmuramoyl-pentapeptide-transferase